MKRTELLELIEMANNAEERMVSSISEHISSALEWFKGTKEESEILKNGLKKLRDESERHTKFLESLKKKVAKDGKDVY